MKCIAQGVFMVNKLQAITIHNNYGTLLILMLTKPGHIHIKSIKIMYPSLWARWFIYAMYRHWRICHWLVKYVHKVHQTSKSFMVIILRLCINKLPRLIKKKQFGSQSSGNVSQFLPRMPGSLHHYHVCGADFHSLNKNSFYAQRTSSLICQRARPDLLPFSKLLPHLFHERLQA